MDIRILESISYIRCDFLTILMKIFSVIGDFSFYFVIILFFFIFWDNKIKYKVTINLVVISLINNLLKVLIKRDRPYLAMINESSYSFPSGHTMAATFFYGYLIYIVYKSKHSKRVKISFITSFSLIATLIIFSRLYLGVHYPSDVLVGFLISLTYLLVVINYKGKKLNKN